ncbi:hypothetical protein VCUG_01424 [Vavraia culicis subsp. floridensis]|uniref:Uncharacterized protein n=1 Tax=Vavraia culicis (isolate floridensis) TaxID=948595 RepID=L2GUS9_VAVCU|nr:uncharacterized protein VCUG_01424 [Vavraia culicis subsp. floridensis]ELA47063.1 hypothetical protein VCUG_01424 [Vavraia culicis subsp. floridensis]
MSQLSLKKKQKLLSSYKRFLESLPSTLEHRKRILHTHFGEFLVAIPTNEDFESKINAIIGKMHPHPYIYLASSIGFSKMTWNRSVEKILNQFELKMKLKYPTLKNYSRYEKLKYLLIRYFDKRKELGLQNDPAI